MLKGLQEKWKVSAGRVILILVTFATGGSLTGYAGKKVMGLTGIDSTALYIPIYIIFITIIWPLMVLLVSIPLGQFFFFKKYISKMGKRMVKKTGSRKTGNKP
ncbi:MAG TPA: DUF6787 family protein [Flavisolibacter sp.]|nr:DUF6787 family protein [Flavisolibacter sp.]